MPRVPRPCSSWPACSPRAAPSTHPELSLTCDCELTLFLFYVPRFNYTIRFASWSGEEMGLYGSRAYAAKAKAAGEDIVAALNADMIGTAHTRL